MSAEFPIVVHSFGVGRRTLTVMIQRTRNGGVVSENLYAIIFSRAASTTPPRNLMFASILLKA